MPGPSPAWLVLLALSLSGCFYTSYLGQAIYGQDDLSWRTRDIEDAIADPSVDAHTRQMLALIGDVKRFGERHALEPTNSYREFVDLDRDAVVHVVSASHPLRFESVTWWFPIVGSVPYLGWFNERDAQRFARDLAAEGYDVDVRGASAYSTLGFFDDPILSTMIPRRGSAVGDLVAVVLHESVHATHYIGGQTYFNESLADWVGDTLAMDYLTHRLELDRWVLLAWEQAQEQREHRALLFHQAYKKLEAVYADASLSDAAKLQRKHQITEDLRREVGFWRPINNAVLAQSRQYHGANTSFAKLYEHCGRDWSRFWVAVKRVDASWFSIPNDPDANQVIARLMKSSC